MKLKRLPAKARRHINAAINDLDRRLQFPDEAPIWIQGALRNVNDANSWIVARQLLDDYQRRYSRNAPPTRASGG